ncbi:MAG: 50S ribosomal protein L21 [Armatimonadetes bacterium JP3_11]|jgi:large subunit ribosomal protein L21|nr:MAG: 50S ribosomal protein L21 [Armatimonadetes bacterium JP3_11]
MYAIIQTGGKQYRVEPNTVLSVEKIDAEPGAEVEISEVLMVRTDDGIKVGAPYVAGAKVVAEVVKQTKAPKIIGFKYKPKKNERKRWGHRQRLTVLRIKSIEA